MNGSSAKKRGPRLPTAVHRAFYAALSAIRSLLILEGSNQKTHEGVITMLSLRLVKPDLLPAAFVKNFKTAEEMIQPAEKVREALLP